MIDLIRQRLTSYDAKDALGEEQAIKEILQEVALYSLWRGRFFETAAFHMAFDWGRYLDPPVAGLTEFGLRSEVLDRSNMDRNIRETLIKNDSVGNQLNLSFTRDRDRPKLKIKLEIDVNPPAGSMFAYTYFDFPLDFEVCHQDLPSNFALKIHALLCRPYVKGRDWFDFNCYLRQDIAPNLPHLQAALDQFGPWKGQSRGISTQWVIERLTEKIANIDWKAAAAEVERFLGATERESLKLWSTRFFSTRASKLRSS